MADDQSSKNTSIDDLVRELSKSSTSPGTTSSSPPSVSQANRPPFPTQKPMTPPPSPKPSVPVTPTPPSPITPSPLKPLETPRPQFNVPPPPFSQLPIQSKQSLGNESRILDSSTKSNVDLGRIGTKPVSPPVPGVKEYQSSIRTMNEDISRLKQGQKPAGIDVPRKVEQVAPAPQTVPPKPNPPTGGPNQQFKIPNVNLGDAQKAAPLAPSKDISKTTPPSVPKIEPKPQIYVPQEGPKGGSRNMLFMGIGAVALIAGFAYWFFILRSPATEIVQETPTPTPTPTATPVRDLNFIFSGISTENANVKEPATDLNIIIKTLAVSGGEFKNLNITSESKGQIVLRLIDFIINPAQQLIDNMGVDHKVLLYGQKEVFDSKGQLKTDAVVEKRLIFIDEIKDDLTVLQIAKNWEASMNEDLKPIFEFDSKKQQSKDFGYNSYKGINIRYKNFPYADRSIDYATVSASNGKSYLIIAGSREAMYATIDKLGGF